MENWCQQHLLAFFQVAAGVFFLTLAYLIWGAGPLLFHRSTRPIVPFFLMGSSFVLGALTWLWSAVLTIASFGLGGLILGLLLAGLGVVPLGIIAALLNHAWLPAGSIVVGVGSALGLRALMAVLASGIDKPNQPAADRESRVRHRNWLRFLLIPIAVVCITWLFTSAVEVLVWPIADYFEREPVWSTEAFRVGDAFAMPYVAIIAGARTGPPQYSFVVASLLALLGLGWGLTRMDRPYVIPYLLGLLVAWLSFLLTRNTQQREAPPASAVGADLHSR